MDHTQGEQSRMLCGFHPVKQQAHSLQDCHPITTFTLCLHGLYSI